MNESTSATESEAWSGVSVANERRLIRCAQQGNESEREVALEELLKAFGPFVKARVRLFSQQGVEILDLEQEAQLGFIRAVLKFDLARETRLASFADLWVLGALRRFIARDRLIRLPDGVTRELAQLRVAMRELEGGRRNATVGMQELAAETAIPEERVGQLLLIPDGRVSLQEITHGEASLTNQDRPGSWARAAAVFTDEAEEDTLTSTYETGEVTSLVNEYQGLRSLLEVRTATFEDPRLRRRGSRIANLVRLVDIDRAMQRVTGKHFVALELAGLRDLPLRELEGLVGVRHSTLSDRKQAAVKWMCEWLNGSISGSMVRRHVFWRRLFAWNLGELWVHGEPVAFEVWARMADPAELWTGSRSIPIRAMSAFGEGWLLTPELLGRTTDWDAEDLEVAASL